MIPDSSGSRGIAGGTGSPALSQSRNAVSCFARSAGVSVAFHSNGGLPETTS